VVGVFEGRPARAVVASDHTPAYGITVAHGRACQINNRATSSFGSGPSEPMAGRGVFWGCKFRVRACPALPA
jgi:hypothetical protein